MQLRDDNTLPEQLVTPLTKQLRNQVELFDHTVDRFVPGEFYDALDLMNDSVNALRRGELTLGSCL